MTTTSTWARRNPQQRVQPSRTRELLSDAQKATRKIQLRLNSQRRKAIEADLQEYKAQCEKNIAQLAEKFACRQEYLLRLLHTSPVFKKKRKPNIHNAIVHMKAMEENSSNESLQIGTAHAHTLTRHTRW
jgi:predicted RNA-binding protein Jag